MTEELETTYAPVTLALNTPPTAQYAKGNMLVLRGETIDAVGEVIAEAVGKDQAKFVVLSFFEEALKYAVGSALDATEPEEKPAATKPYQRKAEPAPEEKPRGKYRRPGASAPAPDANADGISEKQVKLIWVKAKNVGMTEDDVYEEASQALGKEVRELKSLTKREGSSVIDRLIEIEEEVAA